MLIQPSLLSFTYPPTAIIFTQSVELKRKSRYNGFFPETRMIVSSTKNRKCTFIPFLMYKLGLHRKGDWQQHRRKYLVLISFISFPGIVLLRELSSITICNTAASHS